MSRRFGAEKGQPFLISAEDRGGQSARLPTENISLERRDPGSLSLVRNPKIWLPKSKAGEFVLTAGHAERAYELTAQSLTAPEFKVLMCLCFQADEHGKLELVVAEWASGIGYKPSAAKAWVASLQKKGLIERKAKKLGRGNSDFTVITLSLDGYAKAQRKKKFHSGQMPKAKPLNRTKKQAAAEQLALSL